MEIDCKKSSNDKLKDLVHEIGNILISKAKILDMYQKHSIITKKSLKPKSLLNKLNKKKKSGCC